MRSKKKQGFATSSSPAFAGRQARPAVVTADLARRQLRRLSDYSDFSSHGTTFASAISMST